MKGSGCPRMIYLLVFFCGYVLTPTCQGSPRLLFANRKDILLVNTSGTDRNATVLLTGLNEASAIDFLYATDENGNDRSTYCWANIHTYSISCATQPNLNNPQRIVTGLQSPDGLAIDWITEKLYWVDAASRSIEVCVLKDGSHRKVLYWDQLDQPRALSLDPQSGYMYWTDWGEDPKIERGGMNGDPNTRSTLISNLISWPNGITIDYVLNRIFWVDASLSYIHSADLEGNNRTVIKDGDLSHPFAITVYEDRLYWTDWKNRSIFSCSKIDGSDMIQIQGNLYAPMDIDVFEPDRQPSYPNPCAINNGGCSHLCLLAPAGGINCACPTGTRLNKDNLTCADVEEMIFLARRIDLRMISLDTPDFTDSVIDVKNVVHAIAIDYDPVDRFVYWTDDEARLIQRAKLDGTEQKTIINVEVIHPDGVAIDWISRNIFWTDTGTDRIEVARLDGSSRRVIISDGLDEPRAISVDPVNGWIFWTDWGTPAKIEKAAMDGSMRQVLINDSLIWPNGLALDFEFMRLYWADAKLDKIERSNLDGTERTVIVDSQLPHVFGFDVAGQYIYWTDWQRRTIERVDKNIPNSERLLIVEQLPDLMSIRAIPMRPNSTYTNGCAGDNGQCTDLCLNTPVGYTCACPMGMELLPDNKTCIKPEAFLLFSQPKTIKRVSIQYAHKDTALPIQNLMNVTALDIHVSKELLYFSDNINGSIRHACLNGSSVGMVLEFNKESPTAMVIDWISNNLYFIEDTFKRIEVYNVHTGGRKVLIWKNLGEPWNIAIHPSKGFLYWTDFRYEGRSVIGRSRLNGSEQNPILSGIGRCGSISVDLDKHNSRIYWINYDKNWIQSAGLNGEDLKTIKSRLAKPLSLNIYGSYLYWYDIQERAIRRVNKVNTSEEAIIQTDIDAMINLLVFHDSRQQGWSDCALNNNGCQYFCFSAGHKQQSSCGCPTHYELNWDGKTCSAPADFLLMSERSEVSARDVQIKRLMGSDQPDLVLPMKSLRSVKSLQFDSLTNTIYWIDSKYKAVRKSSAESSQVEVFLHSSGVSPASIAIDPYSRHMYWTDTDNHCINITTLSGTSVGVIYNNSTYKPTSIAVNARKGLLFFIVQPTDASLANKVLQATLDGKHIKEIVKGVNIVALTIDTETDLVYYSEMGTSSIKVYDLNGNTQRTLVDNVVVNTLTVYNDKLYYAQDSTQLFYVDKKSGRNPMKVMRYDADITSVFAVDSDVLLMRHPCANRNGDCSHICYLGDGGVKMCGCPQGLTLHTNMLSCEPTPTCSPSNFACMTDNGQMTCIPSQWRCDGSEECMDGSDEKDCVETCKPNQMKCGNGLCVDLSRRCNGFADCDDSSDEPATCCTAGQFTCTDSLACIPKSKVSDGIRDCPNGSDEPATNSPNTSNSSPGPDNPYAVGIIVVLVIVSVFILFIIVFIIWKCHKRSAILRYADPNMMVRHVHSETDSLGTAMIDQSHVPQSVTATTVISASSVSAGAYDRNHVTGASSSSSSLTHLQAGYNPPPSPVTERSAFMGHHGVIDEDDYSTVVSSAYPSYHPRNKRHPALVPPTTPISTCDDSEPSLVNYSQHRPRVKMKRNKKYHLLKQQYGAAEPFPPPPTPSRSQICSGDEASECPPSPSTVRSYRSTTNNPYPPPPSPEPTSDNS